MFFCVSTCSFCVYEHLSMMAYMHTYQAWVCICKYLLWFVLLYSSSICDSRNPSHVIVLLVIVNSADSIWIAVMHLTVTMLNSSWVKTNMRWYLQMVFSLVTSVHYTSKHHWWSVGCLHLAKHLPQMPPFTVQHQCNSIMPYKCVSISGADLNKNECVTVEMYDWVQCSVKQSWQVTDFIYKFLTQF